jgi:anti-sigma factor ChrR (cupin superfamily)
MTCQEINGDMSRRAVMHASDMKWQASPSGSVWRKRLHLVGGAESGQVTSIVRYEPGAAFPAHDHPEGEEIIVLEGTFSDEHGEWLAGTYLLNPEGFRHAPFSREGCLLFVKLRQYIGAGRQHVALHTDEMPWQAADQLGIDIKPLYSEADFADEMRLEKWASGVSPGTVTYPNGVEILVIKGVLEDGQGAYNELSWLRLPCGARHTPKSPDGCEIYVKIGALPALRSTSTI